MKLLTSGTVFLLFAVAASAQAYQNYESPLVQPISLSADGVRMFATHTADHRLCVYSIANPNVPVLLQEIPVGLEPVAVKARNDDEVWVVNHLSDTVSIVSLAAGRVIETLRVKDEPSDIVFAGGKAFITAAASDQVYVFDAVTRAPLGTVAVFGKDPRNLAVNAAGTKVYAVVQRSGNGTTVVPNLPQQAPTNTSLAAAPFGGRIVLATDPAYAAQIPYTLPDNDVAEIDVAGLSVSRYFRSVGTTNTCIAVNTVTGDLFVANTEARNLVHFEPVLRGHAIDSRITKITTGVTPLVTPFDLNQGINYNLLPNNAALTTALSEPYGVAIDAALGQVFVAAQGTDRIGVLDQAGVVLARIEVGGTPGAIVNTLQKRGPRGLALNTATSRLYVFNKLSSTISVINTIANVVVNEVPVGSFDPTPIAIRDGRKFLCDAKLSGNGTMSCASCHIDGDLDGLAWDLGDPAGSMTVAPPNTLSPFNLLNFTFTQFHPMKGSMTTQTFKGLSGIAPLHWRADRANFQAFNGAFNSLMGGSLLSGADMNLYAQFATSIQYPPNPNQPQNTRYEPGNLPTDPVLAQGFLSYNAPTAQLIPGFSFSCNICHLLSNGGTNKQIITGSLLQEPQQMKVPQIRNMYRKVGFNRAAGPQKIGFGYVHDGSLDNLTNFLAQPVFNPWRSALGAGVMAPIVAFVLAADTGTAPLVGFQVTVSSANVASPGVTSDLNLMVARASVTPIADIDLIALGVVNGVSQGLKFGVVTQLFSSSVTGSGPFTLAQLRTLLQNSNTALTFEGVAPGTGLRSALDRDADGLLDGDEAAIGYGASTAGCSASPGIAANSESRLGNSAFALLGTRAPVNGFGFLVLGFGSAALPVAGITLLVDSNLSSVVTFLGADLRGTAIKELPLPNDLSFANLSLFAQFAFIDSCAPQGLSASRGLQFTLRP